MTGIILRSLRSGYTKLLAKKSNLPLFVVFLMTIICGASIKQSKTPVFQNFYGIAFRGNPHDNLLYAKQMGYDCVFYQPGMENDSAANGLYYYIETPEYAIYKRGIIVNKTFSEAERKFYETYCALG